MDYRLVRSATQPQRVGVDELDAAQRAVVEHNAGPLLVLAGPGTGKTTTLVAAVSARIAQGVRPNNILVLTFSRKAAVELRERVSANWDGTTTEPLARTFHSYAFGLLHRLAMADGQPAPRLLAGAEQDLLIRELLAGDIAGSGIEWPKRFTTALTTRGFATQLRDFLMRAYERGLTASTLDSLGRQYERDEWRAAAAFMSQYADITELRDATSGSGAAYDTAELIRTATRKLQQDPQLLAAERERCAYVFVDEYQDSDPAQEELLQLLCGGGRFLVAVGDPDQSIYTFRGSDADVIRRFPDTFRDVDGFEAPTIALGTCRRSGPELLAASRRIATRLRGPAVHRVLEPVPNAPSGTVEIHLLDSPNTEATYIAHRLRQAHLLDGVSWSDMAILVRSATRQTSILRRALIQAGIPVTVSSDDLPLAEQPAVAHLLLLLRCALHPETLDEESAITLLQSPLGGADPLAIRRLRQQLRHLAFLAEDLRSSAELLINALNDPTELVVIDERWAAPARAIASLLAIARQVAAAPHNPTAEQVLWAVWEHCGLAEKWQRVSEEGGTLGAAADRDLDAVIALLEAAARFSDRLPGAGPEIFFEHIRAQQIPADSLAPRARLAEGVRILTAHAAKGLEWDWVIVSGVQEGVWPDLRLRGNLLGTEDMLDLAAGRSVGPQMVGRAEQLLNEERRLFYVAVTRAKRHLIVTAVDGAEDEQPSRFLDELDPPPVVSGQLRSRPLTRVPRPLNLAGLVAELRAEVIDVDQVALPRRQVAARVLGQLARARVAGAAPNQWWGLPELSDTRSLREPEAVVPVSPSAVEKFDACALRWLLESHGGAGLPTASQGVGVAVHEVAAQAGQDASQPELLEHLEEQLAKVDLGEGWFKDRQRQRAKQMVDKLAAWLADNPRRYLVAEQDFAVRVGRALLRGRVDRLEVDEQGRLMVVDFKTGASAPSSAEVPEHPQLAMYQLAVSEGGFRDLASSGNDGQPQLTGGAALVQLGTSTQRAGEQRQVPLTDAPDPEWAAKLANKVAVGMAGSVFAATENGNCRVCPVMSSCPVQSGQVTQ